MILLIKLLLAHLIGDFLLQPTSWVADKQVKKWRSGFLYVHAAIHMALLLAITWQLSFWLQALIIAGTHLVIDGIKLQFQQKDTKRTWFFIDQLLHLTIIVAVWYLFSHPEIKWQILLAKKYWIIATGALFLTMPVSVVIRELLSGWWVSTEDHASESLPDAGKYIGILERLFVFAFVLLGQLGAIGFLFAAKSIFRFGDLTRAKDRKLTEYILIGTFLSFGLAMLTGLVAKKFIK